VGSFFYLQEFLNHHGILSLGGVMTDEIVYSASEVYKRLGISDSTLRKYMEVLQREGFVVKKDNRGRRQYTDSDIIVIEKLIELSKYDGMTLEKAAKMIV
jgi:DNA-binding transcriptional MerR regulator